MTTNILLTIILILNAAWIAVWYYRKTQTLSYRATAFIRKQKVKPRRHTTLVGEDTLIQLFLANGNEGYRLELSKEYNRHLVLEVFNSLLKKDEDDKYSINSKAKFMSEKSPPLPPLPKDPRAQII